MADHDQWGPGSVSEALSAVREHAFGEQDDILQTASDPAAVGYPEDSLNLLFLDVLQYRYITSMPAGRTLSNPTNNLFEANSERERETEGDKLVWASIAKDGGLRVRDWKDRPVPLDLVAWLPGASVATLQPLLKERRSLCEAMCSLVQEGVLQESELRYMASNLAVLEVGFKKVKLLRKIELADTTEATPADISARGYLRRVTEEHDRQDAGRQIVEWLSTESRVNERSSINHVTVAYAAAYLRHYKQQVDKEDLIQDKHVARILIKFAKSHSRHSPKNGCVILKKYDTTGPWLQDYINKRLINGKKRRWALGKNGPSIRLSSLPVLAAMSTIASAHMGTYCSTMDELDTAGLRWSPFEGDGFTLGYFCSGAPLVNKHYTSAMAAFFETEAMPPLTLAPLAPCVPRMVEEDTRLHEAWLDIKVTIRRICSVDPPYGAIQKGDRSSHRQHQTKVLRYHSAVFIAVLDYAAKQMWEYADCDQSERGTKALLLQNIRIADHFLRDAEKKGYLDTTTDNSKYTPVYLESRRKMLQDMIEATKEDEKTRAQAIKDIVVTDEA